MGLAALGVCVGALTLAGIVVAAGLICLGLIAAPDAPPAG